MHITSRCTTWSAPLLFLVAACGSPVGAAPCRSSAGPGAALQGRVEETGIWSDVALDGPGFFVLQGEGPDVYTRLGQFALAPDGLLVSLGGRPVLGWPTAAATPQPLAIGTASWPPIPTTRVHLAGTLQRGASLPAKAFDPTDPADTSHFSTAATLYDATGTAHQMQLYFVSTGPSSWDWHGMVEGSGVLGGTAGAPAEIAAGRLAFDGSGRLQSARQFPLPTFTPAGQVRPQPLRIDLGDPLDEPGGTGLGGITEGATFVGRWVEQDGMPAGELVSCTILPDGSLLATFSNGRLDLVGRLAVATFATPAALAPYPGATYAATPGSGPPRLARAGSPGTGVALGGALERQPPGATCEAPGP